MSEEKMDDEYLRAAADAAEEFTVQNEYWRRQKQATKLFRAAAAGNMKKIRRYVKPCRNIFAVDSNEWYFPPLSTAARIAAENGRLDAVELIHGYMLSPNTLICDETPLQN